MIRSGATLLGGAFLGFALLPLGASSHHILEWTRLDAMGLVETPESDALAVVCIDPQEQDSAIAIVTERLPALPRANGRDELRVILRGMIENADGTFFIADPSAIEELGAKTLYVAVESGPAPNDRFTYMIVTTGPEFDALYQVFVSFDAVRVSLIDAETDVTSADAARETSTHIYVTTKGAEQVIGDVILGCKT